jgi:hypothetical protein
LVNGEDRFHIIAFHRGSFRFPAFLLGERTPVAISHPKEKTSHSSVYFRRLNGKDHGANEPKARILSMAQVELSEPCRCRLTSHAMIGQPDFAHFPDLPERAQG